MPVSGANKQAGTVPTATYRVQVSPSFDLRQTAAIAPYLADLGVTHLYSSPLLQATPGSQHGYDVVDHSRTNAELGGAEARRALSGALHAHGLGLVLDIVPNHMGVAEASINRWWWDVLRLGPQSAYARYFDIDWSRGRLLLPVLGDGPDELHQLRVEDGELRYYDHRFPLAVGTGEDAPRHVHDHQHYELVSWRRGDGELNYRRFFAISTLAGLRVQEPEVFAATHREVLSWVAAGEVDALRVDHPDGLADPTEYLVRLAAAVPNRWIVVEKITETGEDLPAGWPVAGSTGYDALPTVDGVFVDPAARQAFDDLQTELAGPQPAWPDLVHDCKVDVATGMLRTELHRLARIADIAQAEPAFAELLACFPVYRSYLPHAGAEHLETAVAQAKQRRPDLAATIDALTVRLAKPTDELAVRFAQLSGAVMAKGVEDTAYYRYTRFVAANEVGGDPGRFGLPVSEFHHALEHRQDRYPTGMTTLSTHDTKRSEDVRARLAVLSEMPTAWREAVLRWNEKSPLSDGTFAHLIWQTAIGAWPIEPERLRAYLQKAAREARTGTSWNEPNIEFEDAVNSVVDRIYGDLHDEITEFANRITPFGWSNSLSAKLVQLTMPGIPDVYQGTELWDNSLVDPDNRRPVDFAHRAAMLAEIGDTTAPVDASGAAKLLVTAKALRLRRDEPERFTEYRPLSAEGPAAQHVLAFDRGGAITVATRLPATLADSGGWRDTALTLSAGDWVDVLTGRRATGSVAEMLDRYPVALLTRG
jgi:(1->4)-alpha-D-glucan 1-alpha-D-glucosylmutase